MRDANALKRVVITVNGQQLEFIERIRRTHYPDASIGELMLRALAEIDIDQTGLLRDRADTHG